jgi:nucleoside-diphosphate-sugar epimerase
MRPTACLTGSTGFIGNALARALAQTGWHVRCLIREGSPAGIPELTAATSGVIEHRRISGEDDDGFRQALAGVSVFFHLAGVTRGRREDEFIQGNVAFTQTVLAAVARHHGPEFRRFCHVSSLAVLGPTAERTALDESAPPRPIGWYGQSKLRGEQAVLAHAASIPVTILRPCVVYGPGDRAFLPLFRFLRHGPILYPAGNFRISLIHLEDVIDGIRQSVAVPLPSGAIHHLSGNGDIGTRDLCCRIAGLHGRPPRGIPGPAVIAHLGALLAEWASWNAPEAPFFNRQKVREMYAGNWLGDHAKARRDFGFSPRREIAEGLADTFAWYRRAGWL